MSAFFARRFAGRGLGVGLGLGFAAPALVRHAQCNRAPTEGENDPHLWLEEIEGEAPLTWVKENNKRIGQVLGDIEATKAYKDILAIADSKDKIPFVQRIGGKTGDEDEKVYYNFWQDATHKRGVWRRTSYNGYKSASPEWETVLSVDDLNTAEVPPVVAMAVTGHASRSAYAGYGGREAARRARAAATRREREALAQGSVERLRVEEAAWTVAAPTRFPRSGTLRDCRCPGPDSLTRQPNPGPEPAVSRAQTGRNACSGRQRS